MKNLLALFLSLILIFTFTACDESENTGTNGVSSGNNNSGTLGNIGISEEVTVDEQIVLDSDGIKITVTGFDPDGFMGPELKLLIENNTETNLTVQARNTSINGYMSEVSLSSDVAAGKKANESIIFMLSDEIEDYISVIADMEFSFHIFNTEDWETYLDSQKVSVKTSAFETYNYVFDDSGEVIYDNNGIRVISKGLSEDIFGTGVVLYVENNSGKSVTVQTRNTSVNGFMLDPVYSAEVDNGKVSIDLVTFFSSDFEDNGITNISEIEFSLHIFDTETWNTVSDSDIITLTF